MATLKERLEAYEKYCLNNAGWADGVNDEAASAYRSEAKLLNDAREEIERLEKELADAQKPNP